MSRFQVPHFEERGRLNPKTSHDRMPESLYSSALDYLVITCVDLAFVREGQLLLAQRCQYPRASWWLIGGRMVAGESPIATAQRKAAEEAQLGNLTVDRFQFIGTYSTCFAMRQQEPQQHGSHTVNLTYRVTLTQLEQTQIQLSQTEYNSTYRWLALSEVEQILDLGNPLDRALQAVVHDLRNW
ncbi:NUDIX domain-containing protein [Pantanalinema rosaneae CENA516]|uniref:NUDIX domain-containing protein n=1 Tax=Pantanalinema rosaneae TaxID=1620701 RepID=UPI003D6E5756